MTEATQIETPIQGLSALSDYLMDNGMSALPEDLRDQVREIARANGSPIPLIVKLVEMTYARRDEFPQEVLYIAAQLAMVIDAHDFFGMQTDGRAAQISATIMDMPGLKAPKPKKIVAPEPKSEFLPTPPATNEVEDPMGDTPPVPEVGEDTDEELIGE